MEKNPISIHVYCIEDDEQTRLLFQEILRTYLLVGLPFQIRHWKEDKKMVEVALRYGKIIEQSDTETVIEGIVTQEMIKEVFDNNKRDKEWGKFFTISVGKIWSTHYGSELYFSDLSEEEASSIEKMLSPVESYLSIYREDFERGIEY